MDGRLFPPSIFQRGGFFLKKSLSLLLCVWAVLFAALLPFLCTHPSLMPDKATAYYEKKAQADALSATGPEAELMRLLLAAAPAPAIEESFSLSFSPYGAVLMVGAVFSLCLLIRKKDAALRPALIWTAALLIPFSLFGARLVYCLSRLAFYLFDIAAPLAMLKIWEGGLSLCGALGFSVLAGLAGARLGKAPLGKVMDHLAAPLLLTALFSALADWMAQAGFGPEAEGNLPLLFVLTGNTFRLNVALLAALFPALLLLFLPRASFLKTAAPGCRLALFAFLYGGGMILLESLRRDGHMLWGFVHAEMVFFLLFALGGLLFLAKKAGRLLLALLATLLLSALVILLEFALDRSNLGDIWLYLVYFASISAYLCLGCSCAKRAAGV